MIRRRALVGALLFFTLSGSPAMAVEEPKFRPVLRDGNFEIRDYPALIVAEVTVSGDQKEAASRGFRLLAGYIFGGNGQRQKIAMTAPVAQAPVGETIAMTAPVSQTSLGGAWLVRFTMPASYSLDTLPQPNDPKVKLRRLSAERVAVLRFSGLAAPSDVIVRTAELVAAIRAHHLQTVGPASLAQYDPPWTPWFMRRNEVMLTVTP